MIPRVLHLLLASNHPTVTRTLMHRIHHSSLQSNRNFKSSLYIFPLSSPQPSFNSHRPQNGRPQPPPHLNPLTSQLQHPEPPKRHAWPPPLPSHHRPDKTDTLPQPTDLTGSAPTPTAHPSSLSSLAGLSHTLSLKTTYYSTTIPIWIDEIDSAEEWRDEFLRPEAKEVLAVLGAVVLCFRKPVDAREMVGLSS